MGVARSFGLSGSLTVEGEELPKLPILSQLLQFALERALACSGPRLSAFVVLRLAGGDALLVFEEHHVAQFVFFIVPLDVNDGEALFALQAQTRGGYVWKMVSSGIAASRSETCH